MHQTTIFYIIFKKLVTSLMVGNPQAVKTLFYIIFRESVTSLIVGQTPQAVKTQSLRKHDISHHGL